MGDHELRAEVQERLVRAIADIVLFNHRVANVLGLAASDAHFITLLQAYGPMTPGRLAVTTGLGSGTVSGVLDRLEQAGFVHRGRDPHDRRKVIVTVDDAAIGQQVAPLYAEQGARVQALLTSRDTDQLRIISAFLRDLVDQPPATG